MWLRLGGSVGLSETQPFCVHLHHGYEWWLLQLSKELRRYELSLYFFGVSLATLRYMSYIYQHTRTLVQWYRTYMNSFAVVLVSCINCFWNSHRSPWQLGLGQAFARHGEPKGSRVTSACSTRTNSLTSRIWVQGSLTLLALWFGSQNHTMHKQGDSRILRTGSWNILYDMFWIAHFHIITFDFSVEV